MATIIITGASGNLGTTVTRHFLKAGHRVIATVHRKEDEKELPNDANLEIQTVNLSVEEESSRFIDGAILTYKRIDAALLLAGGFAAGKMETTDSAAIKKQI